MLEEMALKYLACTIRATNPSYADKMPELWYEYEEGSSRAAVLVRQVDKLECIQQAVIYEERTGKDMSDIMKLQEKITLPELKPLLSTCLQQYRDLQARQQEDVVVIFVSGMVHEHSHSIPAECFSGGPGVGKGTQCTLLAKEFGFHHISVGELLREEGRSPTSPYRDFIPESIKKSVLLPAQLITQLLKREMGEARAKGKYQFLLDGFPRSVEQALDFELKVIITTAGSNRD